MRKRTNRLSQCKSCQTVLSAEDNFCPNCGQENHYVNHSIKEVWGDFISSAFNFDRKVWQTFYTLFRFPGKMSRDFVDGIKVKYVPPFRFYLFLSFVFFLLVNTSGVSEERFNSTSTNRNTFYFNGVSRKKLESNAPLTEKIEFVLANNDESSNGNKFKKAIHKYGKHIAGFSFVDSIDADRFLMQLDVDPDFDSIDITFKKAGKKILIPIDLATRIYADNTIIDSIYKSQNIGFLSRNFTRGPALKEIEYYFDKNKQIMDAGSRMQQIINKLSYLLLFMLPVSGFILFLLFYRKRKYYYDSFVLSLHAHSHLLLIGVFIYFFDLFLSFFESYGNTVGFITNATYFLVFAYTVLHNIVAVKVFYSSSWVKTILTSILFLIVYSIFFSLMLALLLVYSVYF